jgi:hypothetical protein
MLKVKVKRTADCVVGGFRYLAARREVGSLLLGLYDRQGRLNHVGFTATISNAERPALTERLEALIEPPGFTGDAPGGPSRWNTERTTQWSPLKATLVVEVEFDHVSGCRFRHGTSFVRWRPDKDPSSARWSSWARARNRSPPRSRKTYFFFVAVAAAIALSKPSMVGASVILTPLTKNIGVPSTSSRAALASERALTASKAASLLRQLSNCASVRPTSLAMASSGARSCRPYRSPSC